MNLRQKDPNKVLVARVNKAAGIDYWWYGRGDHRIYAYGGRGCLGSWEINPTLDIDGIVEEMSHGQTRLKPETF